MFDPATQKIRRKHMYNVGPLNATHITSTNEYDPKDDR